MRTTLNLDSAAMAAAMAVAPGKNKTEVINDALRDFARRHRLQSLLELRGKVHWEGDIDELRGRTGRRP